MCKKQVYGLDLNRIRYEEALALRARWRGGDNVNYFLGGWEENLDLFDDVDTIVASRIVYHFQEDIERFFLEVSRRVENVVIVGNADKAALYEEQKEGGEVTHSLGEYLYYASKEGIIDLVEKCGYSVSWVDTCEDPIIVARKALS